MAYFCTNCGTSLSDNIKFCTDCGNKIEHQISINNKLEEVNEVGNKSETDHETTESPVNTFCRGDESLEELLQMVALQRDQKSKLGVLQLITSIIKRNRPDIYNQFIQKLSEIEPELFQKANDVYQKLEINAKKENLQQTSASNIDSKYIAIGILALIIILLLIFNTTDIAPRKGSSDKVWSAEHGHWHDPKDLRHKEKDAREKWRRD